MGLVFGHFFPLLSICLIPAARCEFPEAADLHHFGSNENPKHPNHHHHVSASLVSKCEVFKHKKQPNSSKLAFGTLRYSEELWMKPARNPTTSRLQPQNSGCICSSSQFQSRSTSGLYFFLKQSNMSWTKQESDQLAVMCENRTRCWALGNPHLTNKAF